MEKRPNVFNANNNEKNRLGGNNTSPMIISGITVDIPVETHELALTKSIETDADYEAKKLQEANAVYSQTGSETGWAAIEAMRERTEQQFKLREEALKRNQEQANKYQENMESLRQRDEVPKPQVQQVQAQGKIVSPIQKPISVPMTNQPSVDIGINALSQPQFNTSFDVIPLPSEGKTYRGKRPNVRVSYMTTLDENILTSPNLLQSGQFLEILINRKLLETDLRYKDLLIGDRNAIMLWLRATSYGEEYPVTIYDEDGDPFETIINLNDLKTKKLGAEPDSDGLFYFQLPVSKQDIRFKLMTVGDVEDIEARLAEDEKDEIPVNNANTYRLEKQIIQVGGSTDRNEIKQFVESMRIPDAKALKEYMDSIESGVDLEINVRTPRGGSVKTFLPLNFKFFWPNSTI